MKNLFYSFLMALAVICLVSCQETKKEEAKIPVYNTPDPPVWTFDSKDVELGTTDFETFDIERDYSKLNERLWTDPKVKMYVENTKFKDSINISYNGNKAVVNYEKSPNFTVQTSGAHVVITATKDVACTLTGKTENGSLKVVAQNNVRVNLNGVNLKNQNGPAINIQSEKPSFLVTDSASVLADSLFAQAPVAKKVVKAKKDAKVDTVEKQNGCIYCKGKLAISGRAPLKIIANGADAIHSGKAIFVRRGSNLDIESHAGSGMKANHVKIEGGVVNILSTARGCHGITGKKEVQILGGRTTIISNTGAGIDGKNSRGIKSDSLVAITGGIVRVKESSGGGKGIRSGNKFLAKNCIIDVLTFGPDDKIHGSKNRGILAVNELRIDSSRVRVRAAKGYTEALSCRMNIIIHNSLVELQSRDDAISAGTNKVADIEITNSRVYAFAGMDCVDSNGTLHINSGLFFLVAQSHGCRGFDCDNAEFKVGPECTIVSLGQKTSYPTNNLLEHPACLMYRSMAETDFCLSTTGKTDNLVSFKRPMFRYNDAGYELLLSVPEFKKDVSYDFCTTATVKPEHTFHGLQIGGTATNKTVTSTHVFQRNFTKF